MVKFDGMIAYERNGVVSSFFEFITILALVGIPSFQSSYVNKGKS